MCTDMLGLAQTDNELLGITPLGMLSQAHVGQKEQCVEQLNGYPPNTY